MNNTRPEATITIPVDPYNPGEFFACCGLLELAHRLSQTGRHALGWFEGTHDSHFQFSINALMAEATLDLTRLIDTLKQCQLSTPAPDSKEGPVILGAPLEMTLDWRSPFPQNGIIKTFAGKQELFEIVQVLQQAILNVPSKEVTDSKILTIRTQTRKEVTAYGIEKAENAIDVGFSMDDQKGRLFRHSLVFLEFFALIGAQRFCPCQGQDRFSRIYYTWQIPLPAPLAAIAVSTPIQPLRPQGFTFQMYKRDPQGRYKGFAPARKHIQTKGENK